MISPLAVLGVLLGAIERIVAAVVGLTAIGMAIVFSAAGLLLGGPLLLLFFVVTWGADACARAGWQLIRFAGRSRWPVQP